MRSVLFVFLFATALAMPFAHWTKLHAKTYATPGEFLYRQKVYEANLQRAEEMNKEGHATFGPTKFSDLTPEEFKYKHLCPSLEQHYKSNPLPEPEPFTFTQAPLDSVDWRQKGAVTGVKDQGQCGSCWAFSTTGNIEGQWKIKNGTLVSLSESNIVDCDTGDDGCNGGLPSNAYRFLINKQGGYIDTEKSYPYTPRDGTCKYKQANWGAKIVGSTSISSSEATMAQWVQQNGPMSIALDAEPLQQYHNGIFDGSCGTQLDHAVLIVGFGTENGKDFWIVKNSWGASWGEQGYFRIRRGVSKCGLNKANTSAKC